MAAKAVALPVLAALAGSMILPLGCVEEAPPPPTPIFAAISTDLDVLAALYHATNGPDWTDNTNWLTDAPMGEWHGVTVDGDGRVTELTLPDNGLSGEIPPEVGSLASLRHLQLSKNQLSGDIPAELGNLANLAHVQLNRNQLSGEIPAELGNLANLTHLQLNGNQLSGKVPPELGNLANLTHLRLGGNQLSGEIPPELSRLGNLTQLNLSGNQLSGEIPVELASLANLTTLSLAVNQLNGKIPAELADLASLTTLSLTHNHLSGEIPPELGSLANLTALWLHRNRLTGEIPAELGGLANLTALSLWDNRLGGPIPPELSDLAGLTDLRLDSNELSGEIPPELGGLANLTRLYLNGNQLVGEIPPELGGLINLTELQLHDNQLSGDIPRELGNLVNLTMLRLGHNRLSGEIPPELGSLTGLTELRLQSNRLTGTIPPELGNLINLTALSIGHNRLSGEIPRQMVSLVNLTTLSVSWNRLSGGIPPGLVTLPNLTTLQLEGNLLSGAVPPDLQSPAPVRVEPGAAASRSPDGLPAIRLEPAFGGRKFDRPTELGAYPAGPAGGGAGLFVAEQEGVILLLHPDGGEAVELLDISDSVTTVSTEEGLLSVALDPRFRETGHLWLYYSVEGGPRRTRLARFTADLDDLRRVDPGSELVVLEFIRPNDFHHGGSIRFGSDGMLYLGLGDNEESRTARRLDTLLGSVIRIDVRAASEASPYTVPPGNPFTGTSGARPEIWAYGFRNPWRMAFDPASGVLWAGDVGRSDIEEINHVEAGGDYGWNILEGTRCVSPDGECRRFGLVPPVVEYSHKLGCAVVGGVVYRGKAIPALVGHYLFADFCGGQIWALPPDGGDVIEAAVTARRVSSFGVDAEGEAYVLTFQGAVLRIAPAAATH